MSMLNSTLNTRAILPGSLRYVRSDVPDKLTEQETEWLLRENITTIVDLRTEDEREKRKCPQVDIRVITPHERYMKEFLEWLRESSFV